MPKTTLENPFKPNKPLKDDDIELVRGVLGDEEADEMARLTGDQKPVEQQSESDPLNITTLDLATKEQEELENKPWTRDQIITWVKDIGFNEEMVDEHFRFNKNGSIVVVKSLFFDGLGLTEIPNGIVEIRKDLQLSRTQITSLKRLPKTIGGSLYLDNYQYPLDDLPEYIGKDLILEHVKAKTIPEGLTIKGKVFIDHANQELVKDARLKGYNVIDRQ